MGYKQQCVASSHTHTHARTHARTHAHTHTHTRYWAWHWAASPLSVNPVSSYHTRVHCRWPTYHHLPLPALHAAVICVKGSSANRCKGKHRFGCCWNPYITSQLVEYRKVIRRTSCLCPLSNVECKTWPRKTKVYYFSTTTMTSG